MPVYRVLATRVLMPAACVPLCACKLNSTIVVLYCLAVNRFDFLALIMAAGEPMAAAEGHWRFGRRQGNWKKRTAACLQGRDMSVGACPASKRGLSSYSVRISWQPGAEVASMKNYVVEAIYRELCGFSHAHCCAHCASIKRTARERPGLADALHWPACMSRDFARTDADQ